VPKSFTITITSRTGEKASCAGEFPDDEWKRLDRFLEYADELSATGMVRNKRTISYSMKWHHEQGESHEATLPPPDELSAFLHRMRPFVLDNEPTHVPRILNVLARRVTLPQARRILDIHRKRFLKQLDGDLRISTGEVELTSEETLKKWLNAFEYHRDEDKQLELRAVTEGFPPPSSRAIFLISLFDKANAVFETASLIRALKKRGRAETSMPDGI